jgi:kynurenine formamidase
VLDTSAPLFPGDPVFSWAAFNTIAKDGYRLELISMGTHTGTHMSAPAHFLPGGKSVDQLPASAFVMTGYVLDVRARVAAAGAQADFKLTVEDLERLETDIGNKIPERALVILYTGFQERWGSQSYFDPAPGFSAAGVEWMVSQRGIAGLGSDTFGPDASSDKGYEASHAISQAGGTTLENLTGLDQLHACGDTIVAAPTRLKHGSGFPTNPIALLRA